MSRCTCSKDKQITCIVHPTEVSLKQRIAELEAENQRLRDAIQTHKDAYKDEVIWVIPADKELWATLQEKGDE